jgi:hypothetical protein
VERGYVQRRYSIHILRFSKSGIAGKQSFNFADISHGCGIQHHDSGVRQVTSNIAADNRNAHDGNKDTYDYASPSYALMPEEFGDLEQGYLKTAQREQAKDGEAERLDLSSQINQVPRKEVQRGVGYHREA